MTKNTDARFWQCLDSDSDSRLTLKVRFRFQQKVLDSTPIPIPAQILWFWFQLKLSLLPQTLILIPIPKQNSFIPIPIPIPGLLGISDSHSHSRHKWNHSGIYSGSGIGIMHHWWKTCSENTFRKPILHFLGTSLWVHLWESTCRQSNGSNSIPAWASNADKIQQYLIFCPGLAQNFAPEKYKSYRSYIVKYRRLWRKYRMPYDVTGPGVNPSYNEWGEFQQPWNTGEHGQNTGIPGDYGRSYQACLSIVSRYGLGWVIYTSWLSCHFCSTFQGSFPIEAISKLFVIWIATIFCSPICWAVQPDLIQWFIR